MWAKIPNEKGCGKNGERKKLWALERTPLDTGKVKLIAGVRNEGHAKGRFSGILIESMWLVWSL